MCVFLCAVLLACLTRISTQQQNGLRGAAAYHRSLGTTEWAATGTDSNTRDPLLLHARALHDRRNASTTRTVTALVGGVAAVAVAVTLFLLRKQLRLCGAAARGKPRPAESAQSPQFPPPDAPTATSRSASPSRSNRSQRPTRPRAAVLLNDRPSATADSPSATDLASGFALSIDPEDIPEELLDPVTLNVMYDPVTTSDGHSYERAFIEFWLREHNTSPRTNQVLETKDLVPNQQLKELRRRFVPDDAWKLVKHARKDEETAEARPDLHGIAVVP